MERILQMPIRNAKGGITQYALRNWNLIDKSEFMFDWVTLDKKLDFEDELVEQGCKVYHLSCRQEDDEQQFEKELIAVFSRGYDAIHLHTSFWRGFRAEELAIKAGIKKIIVHAHSTGIDNNDEKKRKELLTNHELWKQKFNTKLATHFTACSENAASFLFNETIPKEKTVILRNAVDIEKFTFNESKRSKLRSNLNVNDKFVILQTGRLEYQKNYEFTLDVFEKYVKQNHKAILLIVGTGSLEQKLRQKAQRLVDRVRFLGFRNDVHELLMAADVFLQPSHFEGFSIATIEAQCTGIRGLVSEAVPQIARPIYKTTLALEKQIWLDELDKAYNGQTRNIKASNELKQLGWDITDSIKVLEKMYND